MSNPNPNPPLWRVMEQVGWGKGYAATPREVFGAELRAIADWLVPEEPRGNVIGVETRNDWARIVMRDERQRLRMLLLVEADRAEAGRP